MFVCFAYSTFDINRASSYGYDQRAEVRGYTAITPIHCAHVLPHSLRPAQEAERYSESHFVALCVVNFAGREDYGLKRYATDREPK